MVDHRPSNLRSHPFFFVPIDVGPRNLDGIIRNGTSSFATPSQMNGPRAAGDDRGAKAGDTLTPHPREVPMSLSCCRWCRQRSLNLILYGLGTLALLTIGGGCQENSAAIAPARPPAIPVSHPVPREVTDYVDFTGRINAVHSVDIRPRVTGYLMKMPFKEGTEVKAGDLLFEIDPRPYQAQVDSYVSQLNLYQAQLKLARMVYNRDVGINSRVPNSISQQQLDQDYASVEEAEARVKSYEKSLEIYKLNLEFTKVDSPIDGQVSRYYLTLGNLVNQDQTLLTTIVSLDPMYAYFDMDEPTLLRIRKAINEGRIKRGSGGCDPPRVHGPAGRGRVPPRGDDQLLQQPGQPDHGEHLGARCLPQP